MKDVFITSAGIFLPNNPISNDEMEDYLGKLNGKDSIVKAVSYTHLTLPTNREV